MNDLISFLNGAAVYLFGAILSRAFAQKLTAPRSRRIFWCSLVGIPLLQMGVTFVLGAETQRQLYPLLVHLPLLLVLYGLTRQLLWSIISVLTAYLCCQLRRWLALLVVAILQGGAVLQDLVELILTVPLLLLLLWFVAPAVRRLSEHPPKLQCQFGAIPALYYVFDYATMVYTNLLTSGSSVVVEFMPFVCCGAYLAFVLRNSAEEQRYAQLQQVQRSLDVQLKQSVREISALRESQELARQYRHDLRHHLQYISACIANGQHEQAQNYISSIDRQIEAQKVACFCENEAANLLLSAFDARAKKEGVCLAVRGALGAVPVLSDSDLCILFSNSLENALHACRPLTAAGTACTIEVQFYEREGRFFMQVTNPCNGNVRFEHGVPVSDRPGHGIGVQSICAIVHKHGGVCTFSLKDERFVLRLSV